MMETQDKITTTDIEIAVAYLFNPARNIVIPCVTWGSGFYYEVDILVITPPGYAYEIEIKTTKPDFYADFKKKHYHDSKRIKRFYYAVPDYLLPEIIDDIPDYAGIITVVENDSDCRAKFFRAAKVRNKYKFTPEDILKFFHFGTAKIWTLKKRIRDWEEPE